MANVTGLITVNGKEIIEVDAAPGGGGGTASPIGSLAMYDTGSVGELYIKTGAADTAWTKVEVPDESDWNLAGNALTGAEFLGSTNAQDVKFYRDNAEVMRLATDGTYSGLLVGLNASIGGRLQIAAPDAADSHFLKMVLNPGLDTSVLRVTRIGSQVTNNATPALHLFSIPQDHNALVNVNLVGRQYSGSSGAVGDGAMYERTIAAKNISGTATLLKVQTDFTYEIVNSMNLAVSISGDAIQLTITGASNRDIHWGVSYDAVFTNKYA